MSLILPTTREVEIAAIIAVLGSVLPPRSSLYVSSPITSGRRLLDWHRAHSGSVQPERQFEDEVLKPNLRSARTAVELIRATSDIPVIDPTYVPSLDGWSQDDYRFLWGEVIQRFARSVVFLEGWEYSSGCVYEYLVATTNGLSRLTSGGVVISVKGAAELVRHALRELNAVGSDTTFMGLVLRELEDLEDKHEHAGGVHV